MYRVRGIGGLIGGASDRSTPLGVGIVQELIARTSPRRIVGSRHRTGAGCSRVAMVRMGGLSDATVIGWTYPGFVEC
jgi:hypothetical protein